MATHTHVPADDEADSLIDLVQDCREISGVLGSFIPAARTPDTRGAGPVDISALTALSLAGYEDYGS
ncbi:MAG: hypothetical protein H7323_11155 [Frankiales bacterium]|nr:hypothetical protein [Frankiales bacterium]